MNKRLLPKKEQLQPITNDRTTFYGCGFNVPFEELSFKKQLQVCCDIVRQSMLSAMYNNPDNELYNMEGNCHSASLVFIDYIKNLGLGTNPRYVIARRRCFEPEDVTTKHAIVLVDDDEGNTYQVDASPFIGYGFGKVRSLNEEKFYQEYEVLEGDKAFLTVEIRRLYYKCISHKLREEEIPYYLEILEEAKKHHMMNGLTSLGYAMLSGYQKRDEYLKESARLNPYSKNALDKTMLQEKRRLVVKQVLAWKQELHDLLSSNVVDNERVLELAQNIEQELKMLGLVPEYYLNVGGENIRFSYITPRFMMEKGLNVVMIKPSAYHLGVRGTIREEFLHKGHGAIGEYFTNMAERTTNDIKPVIFSHTLGDEYERSMDGPADIFLMEEDADALYEKKKKIRESLGKNIMNKEVTWTDGEKILWHPFVTNLVHTTDDPSEAALHYLMAFPEHQLMTRFMYPNPKLKEDSQKVLKKMFK